MSSRPLHVLSYDPGIFEYLGSLSVHATFPRALHVRSGDGSVVSVVVSRWNGPLTIRVSALPRVAAGSVARLHETGLEIGQTMLLFDRAQPWSVQAERFQGLDPVLLRRDLDRLGQRVLAAARGGLGEASVDLVSGRGETVSGLLIRGDAAEAWFRRGRAEIASLLQALCEQERDRITRHAIGLLGLGPGFTPAGDDVLCGLLAGLWVFGRRSDRQRRRCNETLATLSDCIVREAPRCTTSLSSTLLHSATRGVVMEPLLHLLETAGGGAGLHTIDDVLMTGHSSGSDMLTGALLAGATLLRWEELFDPAVVGSH